MPPSKMVYSPGSERSVQVIFYMYDIETPHMPLSVYNDTRSSHVTSAGDHNNISGVELDKIGDLVLLKVKFDSVIDLDRRVGVTDGTPVVGDDMRNTFGADGDTPDFEEFVWGFFWGDSVDGESPFDVVK